MTGLVAVPRSRCGNGPAAARLFRWGSPAILVAIETLALALAALVNAVDRNASSRTLIAAQSWVAAGPLIGAFGRWLPSFVHSFAFSLFTLASNNFQGINNWKLTVWRKWKSFDALLMEIRT